MLVNAVSTSGSLYLGRATPRPCAFLPCTRRPNSRIGWMLSVQRSAALGSSGSGLKVFHKSPHGAAFLKSSFSFYLRFFCMKLSPNRSRFLCRRGVLPFIFPTSGNNGSTVFEHAPAWVFGGTRGEFESFSRAPGRRRAREIIKGFREIIVHSSNPQWSLLFGRFNCPETFSCDSV